MDFLSVNPPASKLISAAENRNVLLDNAITPRKLYSPAFNRSTPLLFEPLIHPAMNGRADIENHGTVSRFDNYENHVACKLAYEITALLFLFKSVVGRRKNISFSDRSFVKE